MKPNKKVLVLFTDFFPYEPYEPYLENEIEFIAREFERIYIFSVSSHKEQIYTLPSNFFCNKVVIRTGYLSKIFAIFFLNVQILKQEKKIVKNILNERFDYLRKKIMIMEFWKARMFALGIKKTIRNELSEKSSIIIYSYWNDFKATAAVMLKAKYPQLKAISRAHGWDVYFERQPNNYLPLKKFVQNHLDGIYFVSDHGKKYTEKILGNSRKFFVSRLGTINREQFNPIKEQTPFHIVSCSGIIKLKRVHLIIEALSLLNSANNVKWTHIGDGNLFKDMNDYAKKLLSDCHHIDYKFTGYIENDKVLERYKSGKIQLLINVSTDEGLPMSMMEAMSFGIPIIGTEVGGVPEIIRHGQNGFLLIPNPDPKEIANIIQYFIDMNADTYDNFSRNAYDMWNSNFNADKNYPEFIKSIKGI